MKSDDLSRDQARALKNKLHPMLGYLGRLKKRMLRRGFMPGDQLFAAAAAAAPAAVVAVAAAVAAVVEVLFFLRFFGVMAAVAVLEVMEAVAEVAAEEDVAVTVAMVVAVEVQSRFALRGE